MDATALYREGRLRAALEAQMQEVKAHPADQARRLFLFELLAFAGDLDRARRHIDALSFDDPQLNLAALAYRKLLDAEVARQQLFRSGKEPQFLAPPPEHLRLRLEAVNLLRDNRTAAARDVLDRAADLTPAVEGTLNEQPFDRLRDFDELFGGVLEVMSQGAYFWLPLEQVASLVANAPRFPRDLLWLPARLEVMNGPAGDVFLPALYPGSHEHPDDAVKMGRAAAWKEEDGVPLRGAGLHTFAAGDGHSVLLDWRELVVTT